MSIHSYCLSAEVTLQYLFVASLFSHHAVFCSSLLWLVVTQLSRTQGSHIYICVSDKNAHYQTAQKTWDKSGSPPSSRPLSRACICCFQCLPAAPTCRSAPCSLQSMYFSHAYDSSVCCRQAMSSTPPNTTPVWALRKSGATVSTAGSFTDPPGGWTGPGKHRTKPQ